MKHLGHWNSDKIVFKSVTFGALILWKRKESYLSVVLKTNPCMGRTSFIPCAQRQQKLGDGFQDLLFSPLFGEDSQFY